MSCLEAPTLKQPFREVALLKKNKFKKVTLMEDDDNTRFIAKAYRGHEETHSRLNTTYAFETLKLFYQHFDGITATPKPLGLDLDLQQVYLEYLPELPSAKLLNTTSIDAATPFFKQCYRITDDQGFLRPISESVYYSSQMDDWVTASKPIALGLKGDLWQNLCLSSSGIMIADIDSAALEPLGLSEVIMHAEIHAELSIKNLRNKISGVQMTPVCYGFLSSTEIEELVDMALQFVAVRMSHLSSLSRNAKIRIARSALFACIDP